VPSVVALVEPGEPWELNPWLCASFVVVTVNDPAASKDLPGQNTRDKRTTVKNRFNTSEPDMRFFMMLV